MASLSVCVWFLTFYIPLERFYLVYWPGEGEDGLVSVHANSKLKGPNESAWEVGGACLVSFGKKWYSGKIAAVGKLLNTSCTCNVSCYCRI